ncbi:unnamed protein product, partial [Iphiclides podalirius]
MQASSNLGTRVNDQSTTKPNRWGAYQNTTVDRPPAPALTAVFTGGTARSGLTTAPLRGRRSVADTPRSCALPYLHTADKKPPRNEFGNGSLQLDWPTRL